MVPNLGSFVRLTVIGKLESLLAGWRSRFGKLQIQVPVIGPPVLVDRQA